MRIHLPAETWAEIFAWLNRCDFARKMEQLWDREFSPIAEKWLHEWSKNNKIYVLNFNSDFDANQARLCTYEREMQQYERGTHHFLTLKERVPIAEVDMPKNICSFELIQIIYLDNTVVAFLHKMRSLLRNNVHLSLETWHGNEAIAIALDHLLPIFSDGGEFESVILNGTDDVSLLRDTRYSSALLNTKVLSLCCYDLSNWCIKLLANWLFTKRADGQPRMLVFPYRGYYEDFVNILQKRFMEENTADESVPFVVRFSRHSNVNGGRTSQNVVVSNGQQQLIMREGTAGTDHDNLLISCPLGMNHEEHLAEWRQKVADTDSFSVPFGRYLRLLSPNIGPLDPIGPPQQQQKSQQSGSSKEEVLAANGQEEKPGTNRKSQEKGKEEQPVAGARTSSSSSKRRARRRLLRRAKEEEASSAFLRK